MERVWGHLFADRLGIDTVAYHPAAAAASGGARGSSALAGAGVGGHARDKRVLLTEAPMNPRENRARMLESMFETFGFAGARVEVQAMLTLYAQGLLSGLVIDSGDGVTHAVAVYDGYCPAHLTRRLDVAGRHVTRYLSKLLLLRGYAFSSSGDFHSVQEMKDALCYVALEPAKDRALAEETTALLERYTLPDGRVVQLARERFEAPEALFQPHLIDVEASGLSDMAFELIQAADVDLRATLYGGIVLSGGSTMFPGLPTRLERDLKARYLRDILKGDTSRAGVRDGGGGGGVPVRAGVVWWSAVNGTLSARAGRGAHLISPAAHPPPPLQKMRIHVEDPPRRKHAVFLGASVLSDIMKDRDDYWWSRAEYQEHGAARLLDLKEGRLKL